MSLSGHIGSRASALVDGQLSPAEEERSWSHVLTCPGCRRLVEREGWTKRQLGALSGPGDPDASVEPPMQLLGSLYAVDAWTTVDRIEKRSTRRRTAVAVLGGGAVGAAVIGLITVAGPGIGRDAPSRPSPATIRQDPVRTPVGSPTGAETNSGVPWVRRSR